MFQFVKCEAIFNRKKNSGLIPREKHVTMSLMKDHSSRLSFFVIPLPLNLITPEALTVI